MGAISLIPLEACRGIAAVVVIFHHNILGFYPSLSGILPGSLTSASMVDRWFFVIANGTGAVNFFFTLSGFVLYWTVRHSSKKNYQIISLLKRYPRLVLPVTVTTVLSYFLFELDAYHFVDAAKISKSPWLAAFAYAGWSPSFHASFLEALTQGMTTFFTGERSYNSNLWTMKPEFLGSVFVFVLAPSVIGMQDKRAILLSYLVLMVYANVTYPYLLSFCTGVFLSEISSRTLQKVEIPYVISLLLIAVGLYLLGYFSPQRDFLWVSLLLKSGLNPLSIQILIHTIGS